MISNPLKKSQKLLRPRSDKMAQKYEKTYFINVSLNPIFTYISNLEGYFLSKKSKSLYPNAQYSNCTHAKLLASYKENKQQNNRR
jgi:hypothetical protein